MPTVHLLIKGKVQGVFYRASAREVALTLDLKGWIKNTREGHVEAIVSGSEKALQQFIEWCKMGPDKAKVISINTTSIKEEKFDEFKVIRG
jgi:acylphosphatase